MPDPVPSSAPRGAAPGLAEVYRRFAEAEAGETSPVYRRVAAAISESDDALAAVGTAPARRRQPALVLAALHDLALAGHAPALAEAYAAGDAAGAARAAVDTLLRESGAVAAIAARRTVRVDGAGRCTVLYPVIAEAARRAGADAVGLVDVGGVAGFNLVVDRVAIAYSDGRTLGDASSPVRLTGRVVGDHGVPGTTLPDVVARVAVGADPLDVTDPDDVRWLRACVWPDQRERRETFEEELALARTAPPVLVRGDPVATVADGLAAVPAGALPVVVTTWALSALTAEARRRFLHEVREASAGRPVAWASVEGVGVAPGVPTLGDRPASGHSIIGLTMLAAPSERAEAVGRCWSRGAVLAWLAGSDDSGPPVAAGTR